jgi:flagellar biosynthetic protein FlhB
MIVAGAAAAAVAAHQVQVGGLWVPGLLAPDLTRLWAFGRGPGLAGRGTRGAWGLVKALVVVAVAALSLSTSAAGRQRLVGLEPHALAVASGAALRQFTLTLGAATLVLGLLDFLVQHHRFMLLLRMTPEEHREDLRSIEGNPALRAQRRQIARTWRTGPQEALGGAAFVLTGAGGLTVVIAGGPPPRRLSIRSIVQGAAGLQLRNLASGTQLPEVAAPALARRLAGRRAPALPLAAEDVAALAAIWPAPPEERRPGAAVSQ